MTWSFYPGHLNHRQFCVTWSFSAPDHMTADNTLDVYRLKSVGLTIVGVETSHLAVVLV